MAADGIDKPPSSADTPVPGTGAALDRPGAPQRDEGTPDTDAAESPASTKGPDLPASALARDEDHALTNETGPPTAKADGTMSRWERTKQVFEHGFVAGLAAFSAGTADVARTADALSPSAIQAIENVSDAADQGEKLVTELSGVAKGDLNLPGTGEGIVEQRAAESTPEVSIDEAPGPVGPDEPGSPLADDIKTELGVVGEDEEKEAEAETAALGYRSPDRFPRPENSPKKPDQVWDRRPTPTGRGQPRGRPK